VFGNLNRIVIELVSMFLHVFTRGFLDFPVLFALGMPWSFSDHNPRSGIAVRGDERDQVGDGDGTKWKGLTGSNIAAVQSSGSSLAQTEIGERISRFRPRARQGQLKKDLISSLIFQAWRRKHQGNLVIRLHEIV
jgi:hypothetical protein